MATSVKGAFEDYRSNLNITDYQTTLVAQRRKSVVDAIANKLVLYPSSPSKLIGSYDRQTLTRYLSEGDVDVMVILHYGENKQWEDAAGATRALDRFKAILDGAFPNVEKRRDRNCITMKYSEFRLDVVPAFSYTEGFYTIPDSVRQTWVSTDPFRFAEAVTDVNQRMGGTFVPLIKMVKGWNRETDWIIRSFHLECLMYNHYASYTQGYTYSSMLKFFFEALPGILTWACYEPIKGDRVDTYMDNQALITRRQAAIQKAQEAARVSADAYAHEQSDPRKSISLWKSLLGRFFPNYG